MITGCQGDVPSLDYYAQENVIQKVTIVDKFIRKPTEWSAEFTYKNNIRNVKHPRMIS